MWQSSRKTEALPLVNHTPLRSAIEERQRMKILLNVDHPMDDGNRHESRLPTLDEVGPFMDRLMRIIQGVKSNTSQSWELHWNVWFLNRKGEPIAANLHVDVLRAVQTSTVQSNLGIKNLERSVASAEGGVSGSYTEEQIEKMIWKIVLELQKSFGL